MIKHSRPIRSKVSQEQIGMFSKRPWNSSCRDEALRTLDGSQFHVAGPAGSPNFFLVRWTVDAVTIIWAMCNASLREGFLRTSHKEAIITPVLKKPSLDPDEPKNYGPISNLSFISKLIERIVSEQVRTFLTDQTNSLADQQSATSRLLQCVTDIDKWMSSNRLKLNADKTEFLSATTQGQWPAAVGRLPSSYSCQVHQKSWYSARCWVGDGRPHQCSC